jgi:hypothetical protein
MVGAGGKVLFLVPSIQLLSQSLCERREEQGHGGTVLRRLGRKGAVGSRRNAALAEVQPSVRRPIVKEEPANRSTTPSRRIASSTSNLTVIGIQTSGE